MVGIEQQYTVSTIDITIRFYMIIQNKTEFRKAPVNVSLVSQWLACLERVRDAFLRFLFAAERNESFAFQIQNILLTHKLWGTQRPSRQNIRQLTSNHGVIFRSIPPAQHHMNRQFPRRQKLF